MDYKPLYIVSAAALLIHIALGTKANGVNLDFHYMLYRNGLLFGLPMFCMGLFIREKHSLITEKFNLNVRKEVIIIAAGVLLSLLERSGIGKVEMPIGTIFEVFAIMMLITSRPLLFKSDSAAKLIYMIKDAPLAIYIIHIAYRDIVRAYADKVDWLGRLTDMHYIYPLIFVAVSLVSGILFSLIKYALTNLAGKKEEFHLV